MKRLPLFVLIVMLLFSLGLIPEQSLALIYGTLTDTPPTGTVTYVATSNNFESILTEDGINSDMGTDQGYQGGYWRLETRNFDPPYPPPEGTDIQIEFAGLGTEVGKFGSHPFKYSGPNENRGEIAFTTATNPEIPAQPISQVLSPGNVLLTWTNVSGVTYDVYRSTQASGAGNGASNGRYQRIAQDITTSPFTDTTAPTAPGSHVWYVLIAKASENRSGHSPESEEVDSSLSVTLSSFTAVSNQTSVTLRWRTESEVGNLGFNIYRSEKEIGSFIKINQSLIPGAGNSAMPNEYQFIDQKVIKDKTYFYYIEDVDIDGRHDKTKILQATVGKEAKKLLTKWGELKTGCP